MHYASCRASLIEKGRKPIDVRCLFIEREAQSFELLDREARSASIGGVIAEAKQGDFEDLIPKILEFTSNGRRSFTFLFIDPKGWTGYGMSKLQALFNHNRSEILINRVGKFYVDCHAGHLFGPAGENQSKWVASRHQWLHDDTSRQSVRYSAQDYLTEYRALAGWMDDPTQRGAAACVERGCLEAGGCTV